MEPISGIKIVVFVLVVGSFIVLSYFLSKAFVNTCRVGYTKDSKNICVPVCENGQQLDYSVDPPSCVDCLAPQVKRPDGSCGDNCTGDLQECGDFCFNSLTQVCISGQPCDKIRWQDYLNQCCASDKIYGYSPLHIPNGFSSDSVKGIADELRSIEIPDLSKSMIDNMENYLYNLSPPILTKIELRNALSDVWIKIASISPVLLNEVRAGLKLPFCTTCSNTLCNLTCCATDEVCIGNICCKIENAHNGKCCKVYSEKDGCCDDSDVKIDGKCGIQCDDKVCVKNSQECRKVKVWDPVKKGDVTVKAYCASTNSCQFNRLNYDPSGIERVGKAPLPVCRNPNLPSNAPLAYCQVDGISSYTLTASDTTSETCSPDDCYGRVDDIGRYDVEWDGKTCKELISCLDADGVKESCDSFPTCPVDEPTQCCTDSSGKLTGLVCRQGEYCYRDQNNSSYSCVGTDGFTLDLSRMESGGCAVCIPWQEGVGPRHLSLSECKAFTDAYNSKIPNCH